MKRNIISILVVMLCLTTFCSAIAENSALESIDLSRFSIEELIILKKKIDDEINIRDAMPTGANNALSTDKEISFNDFVWGMDAKTALKMLIDKKLVKSYASISAPVSVEPWDSNYYIDTRSFKDSGLRISEWCWGETSIAGYEVQETDAYFYYDYNESTVNYDERTSHLYKIQVHLTATDYDYAELDLTNKLTSLFGNPQVKTENSKSDSIVRHIWYGSNNTALSLWHFTSRGEKRYDQLLLLYGKTDSVDHLTRIEKIVLQEKREKEKQNSNNFNGL